MQCSDGGGITGMTLSLDGEKLEGVDSFEHLGAQILKLRQSEKVQQTVLEGSKGYRVRSVIKGINIGMEVMKTIYQQVIASIVTSQTWGSKKIHRRNLVECVCKEVPETKRRGGGVL